MRWAIILLMCSGPVTGQEAVYRFTWDGGNGYRIEGAFSYDAAETQGVIIAPDVSCFEMTGFHMTEVIGQWSLAQRRPETVWRFHFLPDESRFLDESDGVWMAQAWNMAGDGNGCGANGFGFNLGNVAQDICVNDQLVLESQASPFQPFTATPVESYRFADNACRGPALLGGLGSEWRASVDREWFASAAPVHVGRDAGQEDGGMKSGDGILPNRK